MRALPPLMGPRSRFVGLALSLAVASGCTSDELRRLSIECSSDEECEAACVAGRCVDTADSADTPDVAPGGGAADATADASDVGTPDAADLSGGEGLLGDPCTSARDCRDRVCIPTPTGQSCTEFCRDDACPEGWECRLVENERADLVRVCWPERRFLCLSCADDSDCGGVGNVCIPYPNGRFCGRACSVEVACPDDYFCGEAEVRIGATIESVTQCIPASGSCVRCEDLDGDGYGEGPDCLGPDCDDFDPTVYEGAPELCDGLDNNCNGVIDEGFPATDPPDPLGIDENCDFVDGEIERSVFVSGTRGNDESSGLVPGAPVRTISRAMEIAGAQGRAAILITEGVYDEPLWLVDGIGLYGGYSQDFSERNRSRVTEIRGNPAVIAQGVVAPTELQLVSLRSMGTSATRGDGRGEDSVAVALIESPGVLLSHVDVQAGAAGTGTPGAAGITGAAGQPGGGGTNACEGGPSSSGNCKNNCPNANADTPYGGSGGPSACGAPGGQGGTGTFNGSGTAGQNGSGIAPGDRGEGSTSTALPGSGGAPGQPGAPGGHGPGGSAGAPGTVGAWWIGANGADGLAGTHGSGGGGGGGGASSRVSGGFITSWQCLSAGGGGGGGGGGGCAGTGGTGGAAGGASIGVLAIRTNPRLQSVRITSGEGGNGGNGGDQGLGGALGPGQIGGLAGQEYNGGATASQGGRGGDGGAGGAGGAGGGGAGGPSYGVLITGGNDADIDADTRTRIQTGRGGRGGLGGNANAFGNAGDEGQADAIHVQ